ncbi:ferredoxin-related [Abeliophyllum distichum]|uniref:Ferredoxin-related n=1 Tax=Abeliophyllum distichum TaxID=126358 RepID=A0ABD1QA21_9LAMI
MTMLIWFLALSILFISACANVQNKVADNPADQIVVLINSNRTASGEDAKKPAESQFAEIFAPNCGVEASTLTPITGRLLGCQSKYAKPSEAFSEILMKNDKSLEILHSKNHTEVGAAVSGSDGGGPYFWCVLFSNGKSNNSFVPEGGVAKISRPGCFSGANDECSGAPALPLILRLMPFAVVALIALICAAADCFSLDSEGNFP